MKLIGQIVAVLLGISLLGAMGFGAWLAFQTIVALFAALNPEVATVTGIACLVALATAWGIARSLRSAIRQNKAMGMREEKTATYQLFVDYWQNLLRLEQTRTDQIPAEFSEKLKVLDRLLVLYGGAAVVRAHTALRDLERNKGPQHPDVRARFGETLVTIRQDLGADAPRNIATELAQLLLPGLDAGGVLVEAKDTRSSTVLAQTS